MGKEDLERKVFRTKIEMKNQELRKCLPDCNCFHHVCYYDGKYFMFFDGYRYIPKRVTDLKERVEYYSYRCLDCCGEVNVSPSNNEEFLKDHKVIEIDESFEKCRKIYQDLSNMNHVDMVYKKLQKKI